MPDEPKKPMTEEQTDWDEEPPEWKDEPARDRYEKMDAAQFAAMLEDNAAYARYQAHKEGKTKFDGAWKPEHELKQEIEPLDTVAVGALAAKPLQERRWLDGHSLILMDAVHVMGGDGGAGKTDVALQAAIGCQSNSLFLGLPIRTGPVLFFSAEEPKEEIRRRVHTICEDLDIDPATMNGLYVIDMSRQMAWLFEEQNRKFRPTTLWERLKLTVSAIRPVLIIIDNRARIFAGNQNDSVHATTVVTYLDQLAHDNRCAVILLSHVSLSQLSTGRGDSGSVAWSNAGRSRSFLAHPDAKEREPGEDDDGRRVLTNMKANYTKAGKSVEFSWTMVNSHSGYFKCTYKPPKVDENIGSIDKAERIFKHLMRLVEKEKLKVSNNSRSQNYAPNVFVGRKEREGMHWKGFKAAMQNLLHKGEVEVVEEGKPSRRTTWLKLV